MKYELKEKINATEDFLNELSAKGWQEIEYLQSQIANLDTGVVNEKLRQLFKNLLTSYYVFTGEIENLLSEPTAIPTEEDSVLQTKQRTEAEIEVRVPEKVTAKTATLTTDSIADLAQDHIFEIDNDTPQEQRDFEPFEYFVDFDEPSGEPISDEDLYG
jgi:hypothetical protein